MKRKLTIFLTLFFIGIGFVAAQTQVRGTVVDETGDPVIGATIQVKGTTQGTITDGDGNFTISAPAGGTLIVSYVGYKTQEVPVSTNVRVVLLTDSELLEDVIVVAYGTTKKSSFTGAASQVSADKIQKMQVSSLSKSLEGASSGVQISSGSGTPGSNASIIIRGIGSISASQSPLIVVDGVPYEGSLNSIPTQDIESLTILKDAAANSMYGARGSNGVLVITTKKGSSGVTRITFEGRYGFNTRGVPNYDIISNPGEYYEMMYESISNGLVDAGRSSMNARVFTAERLISDYLKYNIYKGVPNNQIIDPYTGKLTPAAMAAPLKWTDSWQKDPFKNGTRQEYNVGISGGNDKTQAYASVSYLGDEGYITNSGFDRITVRAKVDQAVGKRIKTGINLSYANTQQKTFGTTGSNYSNLFMFSQMIAPIFPIYLYDEEGNLMYDDNNQVLYDFGTRYARPYAQEQNPYAVMLDNKNRFISDNLSSRGYLNVNILDNLVLTFNLAYDVFNNTNSQFATPNGGDAENVGGRGYKTSTRYAALNSNQLLNWTPKIDRHSFNLLLGHETKNDIYNYLYGHMTNFVNPNNTDFANAARYEDLTSYTTEYALEGFFSRLEYNFADKYYLSTSFRRDASSRFHPDVRWGSFYAFGAAWRVNEEPFMEKYESIHNLRLKASYGTQGNDNLGYSKVYNDLYDISRIDGEPGLTKIFRGNPALTWEKSNNFNVGFELGLLSRFNLSADFFVKETKDMLYSRPFAPSDGNPSWMYVNDIDMKNVGLEFDINGDIIKNKDIKWNVAFNGTTYKNKLTRLPSDKDPEGYQAGSYWREIGGSLYDYYTYEYVGVDPKNGKPLYNKYTKNDNGEEEVTTVNKTSDATLRETGKSSIPDFYGGLSTTVEAYSFDLSISTAFQLGGYVWDSYYQGLMNPGDAGENMHKNMFNRWTPAHTNTDIPRLSYQNQDANSSADRWLTKASYFSLRNITLGYTLPKNILQKADIQSARVYLTGDNIWMKSVRKGLDPRQSFTGSTGYAYSALSTYSIGLSLTF